MTVRQIREILRATYDVGLTRRQVALSLGIAPSTVLGVLRRADSAGLTWPLPADLDDATLDRLLFPPPPSRRVRPEPNWAAIHQDLRKKGMTLQLAYEEYRETHPQDGLGRTQFLERYHRYVRHLDLVMRQTHTPGEKLFIDYAGPTVPVVVNRKTGEVRQAQIFVAVLGASSYTYADASWSQDVPSLIASTVRALEFLGGVPKILVPDNLKAAVLRTSRYEPRLNPAYLEMARHYGMVILPARVRRPKDKARAEAGVQLVERWVLARLRNRRFFSLDELNRAIRELLDALNERPFQKLEGSRRSVFEQLDKPALGKLPAERYVYAEWRRLHVHPDYHVETETCLYSVPYHLVGEVVDVRLTATTVEVFFRQERVASHPRLYGRGKRSTSDLHMPPAHRAQAEQTVESLSVQAHHVGENTGRLVEAVFARYRPPALGIRTCQGILSLARRYPDRIEQAAARALSHHALSYGRLKAILEKNLDRLPFESPPPGDAAVHENVRGAAYFRDEEAETTC